MYSWSALRGFRVPKIRCTTSQQDTFVRQMQALARPCKAWRYGSHPLVKRYRKHLNGCWKVAGVCAVGGLLGAVLGVFAHATALASAGVLVLASGVVLGSVLLAIEGYTYNTMPSALRGNTWAAFLRAGAAVAHIDPQARPLLKAFYKQHNCNYPNEWWDSVVLALEQYLRSLKAGQTVPVDHNVFVQLIAPAPASTDTSIHLPTRSVGKHD